MTDTTYRYVGLPDACVVTTRALLTARENITDTVAARAMMCIHGGAGFGKTLAVNTCLRALEPAEDVRKITFRCTLIQTGTASYRYRTTQEYLFPTAD